MFYLYCVLAIALFMVVYVYPMNRFGNEVVEMDGVFAPKHVEVVLEETENIVEKKYDPVGVLLFVPKVPEEPKPEPKPDLREQYRIWLENAKRVNEAYQREQSFRTQRSIA